MRNFKIIGLAPMLLMGAMLCANAAESTPGRVMDDSAITTKVKAALVGEKDVSALKVHVKTYKGRVQLNGHVDTQAEKDAAEATAAKVEGVVKVKNNLVVGKLHHTAGKTIDDTEITTKVKTAFVGSPEVKATQISVTTKGGVVTLAGFADNVTAKVEAERLTHQVEDVKSVVNNVQIRH